MRKRISSILLCLVMVIGLLPTAAFAAEEEGGGSTGEPTTGSVIYVDATGTSEGDGTEEKPYDLATAVNNAKSGDTIQLAAGTYTLYQKGADVQNKNLTFVGAGTDKTTWLIGPKVPDPAKYGTEYNSDYSFDVRGTDAKETVTFKDMTLQSGSVNYLGFAGTDITVVEDCVIEGKTFYWGYTSATFKNTTFDCPPSDYAIWTYSSPIMTFDNCTFNSSGKVINVYTDYDAGKHNITVNFKDCTVNNTTHKKQVLKINDKNMGNCYYTINISGNNVVKGIEPNKFTCSRLFGFDPDDNNPNTSSENSGRTVVNIEGTTVWKDSERTVKHNRDFTTGSYNNGVAEGNANQYTDGYKDNAFTTTYGSWEWNQNKNKLVRTVTKTCNYCGYKETTQETKELELDVSRSKTATALDSSNQSTVTLSLPSAEEKLSSDVVFVLDASDCVGNVMNQVSSLVAQLKTAQENSKADIKVGAVIFNGSSYTMFDGKLVDVATAINKLQDLSTKATTEKEVWAYFGLDKDPNYVNKGSNLHAGLRAAQKLLDSDASVAANRKYVVTVTDGMTYYWNDDQDNVYGIYSGSNANGSDYPSLLFYAWCEAHNIPMNAQNLYNLPLYGLPTDFEGWDAYLENAKKLEEQDDGKYTVNVREAKNTLNSTDFGAVRFSTISALTDASISYIPISEAKQHAHGVDYSVTACFDTYQEMVAVGYQCYTLNPEYNTNTFPGLFTSKLNEMAGKTVVDFNSIQNDILYAVGEGSVVEDKMGADFDFVPGSLKLTVNKEPLDSKVDGNTIYFGAKEIGSDNYRFKVEYDSTNDKFTWTINENVSNFAPVQLSYQVKLVNRNTAAGTYTVPTNEYATLTPKNSAGYVGKELEFNKPDVTYTVSGGGSGGGDSSTTYYYFAIEKIDAQDSHTLNGAKFGLYLDGKQIATATSNRSGIATFRVDESSYRKITTTSSLYYQELTAPEGYVVSSDKIDIEKSDLTTSQTTAEKKAETVRNYRSSTPDLLNDDDHFAYVIGYKDGYVRPYGLISRAETTTIFFRLLKDSVRDGNLLTSNTYTDVPDNYWANTAISTMTGLGIVQGRSSTTFDPQAPITRAQFAAICARFDTGTSSGIQTFSDISGHWAEKYIQRAAELGWIKGFEDGTFRPDTYITRAQAMTMINRVLNRIPEETSDLLSNMNVWPDCNPSDWFYLAVQEATNSHDFKHKAGNYETWTGMNTDPNWTRYEN